MRKFALSALAAITVAATAVSGSPASAAPAAPAAASAIVTFDALGEIFRARIDDPASIQVARDLLAGTAQFPAHPNGTIVYGSARENTGWSWHLEDTIMSDISTEVCDGLPSDVEKHAITSPYFCPWGADVIAVENA